MTVTWWIDGRLVPADQAGVPADDHGLVVGDGVFETLRVRSGAPFAIRRHLARLRRSAAGLDLPIRRTTTSCAPGWRPPRTPPGWPQRGCA